MEPKDSLYAKIAFGLVVVALICFICQQAYSSNGNIQRTSFEEARIDLIKSGCKRYHRKVRQDRCLKRKAAELQAQREVAYK